MILETGWGGRPWTELTCVRTGTNGELLTPHQRTFRLHKFIRGISSIGNELLAFTEGPCSVALFRFNPHLSMIHEYFSLLLDQQNRFFFFDEALYLHQYLCKPSLFPQICSILQTSLLFNILEKRTFRVQIAKFHIMRISFLCYFISLSGPAYNFTIFYQNGDKLLNPQKKKKNMRNNIFVSKHIFINIMRFHTKPFNSHTVSI